MEPSHQGEPLWFAVRLITHVGVIAFVLISGFFGIRATPKGFIHLILLVFIYWFPLEIIDQISIYRESSEPYTLGNWIHAAKVCCCFISSTTYWFVKTYIMLYLMAPLVNKFIESSKANFWYVFVVSGVYTLYVGGIMVGDPTLAYGSNVINFIFIYMIGRTIAMYKERFVKIPFSMLMPVYILLNTGLFVYAFKFLKGGSTEFIELLFYNYPSAGLILNSVLLFLIFLKVRIKSRLVNWIAASTFSMYLFHHQFYMLKVLRKIVNQIDAMTPQPVLLLVELFGLTVAVIVVTVIVDKLLMLFVKPAEKTIVEKVNNAIELFKTKL